MNFYRVSDQPVPTPDVRSSIKGDLYVNLMAFEPNGANATVKVIIEPLVPWIWFGGFVIVLGSIVGMFHSGRRKVATPSRSGLTIGEAEIQTPLEKREPMTAVS